MEAILFNGQPIDFRKIDNIVYAGMRYPDDYIMSADYDGREMTDDEVEHINSDHYEFIHESKFS